MYIWIIDYLLILIETYKSNKGNQKGSLFILKTKTKTKWKQKY